MRINVLFSAVLLTTALAGCGSTEAPPSYDILIINGTVYNGSLSAPTSSAIGVTGDRIVSMNAAPDAEAA
ncbi:MAG: hypothetical protein VYC03_02480, partial [Pseudomonadota bacterium]|nr:hypothetical protein [Pseudomonadota bacterium]